MYSVYKQIPAVLLLLLLSMLMGMAGCGGGSDLAGAPRTAAQISDDATSRPSVLNVSIDNFSFNPPVITIPVGTTITWVNRDDVPHTVTANDKGFASKTLDTDDRFSHVFAAPGTYPYYCAVHPHMAGQVIVKE